MKNEDINEDIDDEIIEEGINAPSSIQNDIINQENNIQSGTNHGFKNTIFPANNGKLNNQEKPINNQKQNQPLNKQNDTSNNGNFIKDKLANRQGNSKDSIKLQDALNKRNNFPIPQKSEKDDEEKSDNKSLSDKLDKTGEEAVKKFGGKAITAATGGAVSGPAADAIANKVAKPTGKMLKYILVVTILPIVLLLIIILILFSDSDDSNESNSEDPYIVSSDGICSYTTAFEEGIISDVKVRLLNCDFTEDGGKSGEPIASEELIDLEDYVAGVVSQEIGNDAPEEAIKAQAIAVRSYALTRMSGQRLKKENGKWILEMKTCTEDQVFCNPYKGCHSRCDLSYTDNHCYASTDDKYGQGGTCHSTVYSGNTEKAKLGQCNGTYWNKGPLPQKILQYVKETRGQVALNNKGNVAATPFGSAETNQYRSYANDGKTAYEIITKMYGEQSDVKSISSSCENNVNVNGASGWKQCDNKWGKDKLGNSSTTICQAGCAATSVSIQLALSKVQLTFNDLNPGTFVKEYTKVDGFSGNLIYFQNINKVAPKFQFIDSEIISGTKLEKANKLQEYKSQGEYIIIGVYKTADSTTIGHWVAYDRSSGENIYIYDPGQSNLGNKLFDIYKYTIDRNIEIKRYKIVD